jgi:hypothetical protein
MARSGKHDRHGMQLAGDSKLRYSKYRIGDCRLLARLCHKTAAHRTFRRNAAGGIARSGSGHLLISRHPLAVVMGKPMADSMASCPAAAVHAGSSQQRRHQRKNQRHSHRDGNQASHYELGTIPAVYTKKQELSNSSSALTKYEMNSREKWHERLAVE